MNRAEDMKARNEDQSVRWALWKDVESKMSFLCCVRMIVVPQSEEQVF